MTHEICHTKKKLGSLNLEGVQNISKFCKAVVVLQYLKDRIKHATKSISNKKLTEFKVFGSKLHDLVTEKLLAKTNFTYFHCNNQLPELKCKINTQHLHEGFFRYLINNSKLIFANTKYQFKEGNDPTKNTDDSFMYTTFACSVMVLMMYLSFFD